MSLLHSNDKGSHKWNGKVGKRLVFKKRKQKQLLEKVNKVGKLLAKLLDK